MKKGLLFDLAFIIGLGVALAVCNEFYASGSIHPWSFPVVLTAYLIGRFVSIYSNREK